MAATGAYIVSVSVTALICGIVKSLVKDSSGVRAIEMVCSLMMLLAVLRPVLNLDFGEVSQMTFPSLPDASYFIEEGELVSRNTAADIIKQNTEAYILDKAAAMGLEITVSVTVSNDDLPVPLGVELSGKVSPYLKLRLEEMILQDLNITKENQTWTG